MSQEERWDAMLREPQDRRSQAAGAETVPGWSHIWKGLTAKKSSERLIIRRGKELSRQSGGTQKVGCVLVACRGGVANTHRDDAGESRHLQPWQERVRNGVSVDIPEAQDQRRPGLGKNAANASGENGGGSQFQANYT